MDLNLKRIALPLMLAVSLLSGCASVQNAAPGQDMAVKRFEVAATQSRIYIYRNEFMGSLVGLDLEVDGKPAGTTKGKTFVVADVEAGEHQLVSKGENTHALTLMAKAGEPAFVWQEVKMGLLSAGSRLHSVDASTGRAGVLETSLVSSPLMAAPPSETRAETMPANMPAVVPAGTATFEPAAMAAAPDAAITPAKPAQAAPMAAAPAAPKLTSSRYDYEAERAAKERGCMGPGEVRPRAQLQSRSGIVEIFSVACAASSIQVRCEMGMCKALD
ncbi:DUF2846 domain-containing protein [Roseateles oligotrophus]|uniref:DUF2846 domain-containing protein n=1 Tax=Roseateles oligotrophus TaxID=1769250 RepID=A0ABT2YK55_9BURK|nr:DUF2846 domain-containing protein [Roseateles oligotrophus]MCV2370442.1 DUF2846 domain-containing protein [Roseateles oligotrophus]